MKLPVLVNIEHIDEKKLVNIGTAVLDFHCDNIKEILNCYDGFTLIHFLDGTMRKVLLPFDVVFQIYNEQNNINISFKEEVDELRKDNFKATKNRLNGGETD